MEITDEDLRHQVVEQVQLILRSFTDKISIVKAKDSSKTAAFSEVPAVRVIKHKAESAFGEPGAIISHSSTYYQR